MILIKNAKLLDEQVVDILIEDKKIKQIGKNIDKKADKIIHAKGFFLLPGIVDLNVRLRDNILSQKNLDELENTAIKAGITRVVLNCDFEPDIHNKTYLELLFEDLKKRKIKIYLNIKGVNKENKLNNISILLKAGAKVVHENSDINSNLSRRLIQYAKMHNNPLFFFCQNKELSDNGVMNEDEVSFELGLPGISKVAEISETAKIAAMAEYYGVKVHFQTLSTKRSLEIAKEYAGASTEVSIHHLLKDDSACKGFNTYAKINPPLRSKTQKEYLVELLQKGKIDTITTLFSPWSIVHKDLPFELAKYGIDEMEEFLPLLYTHLVKGGIISFKRLYELIFINPLKILNEKIPDIKEGEEATFVLFNPDVKKEHDKQNSIYKGEVIYGKIEKTFIKAEEF